MTPRHAAQNEIEVLYDEQCNIHHIESAAACGNLYICILSSFRPRYYRDEEEADRG
jgi:hypothetical protein